MVKSAKKRIRFERHPSQVVFDPDSLSYVVTWAKFGLPVQKRLATRKSEKSWIPSVSAMAELYDRGCVGRDQTVYAAAAVGRAWAAGDRHGLDTDSAKKAAELVNDLATMCMDSSDPDTSRDVGQAMRRLLDEMAAVRFQGEGAESFDDASLLPAQESALRECLKEDGYASWPPASKRRKFLYCFGRKERTPVLYTLAALLFDTGCCPLLSLSDRRALRMRAMKASGMDDGFSVVSAVSFLSYALRSMSEAKREGKSRLGLEMTQQELSDIVTGESYQQNYQHIDINVNKQQRKEQ